MQPLESIDKIFQSPDKNKIGTGIDLIDQIREASMDVDADALQIDPEKFEKESEGKEEFRSV